jgi:FAD/FMN-containing dehydrogenase
VAHLGDGNLHFAAWPESRDADVHRAINRAVEEETIALGGSFSAEHGIGLSKLPAMVLHKDPVALGVMRAVKRALDPQGIMNPGKVVPDR